jgi:hypothetical protein
MIDFTQEQIHTAFTKLSRDMRYLVASSELSETLSEIANKHNLDGLKMTRYAEFVGFALMGLISQDDFSKNLASQINTDAVEAQKIAEDTEIEIFAVAKDARAPVDEETAEEIAAGLAPKNSSPSSNLATIPNDQPYTGGGLKSSIPLKDVNPFLPPLSKNANPAVPRIVVPPNVTVSDAFKGPAPEPLASELQTPLQATGEVVSRIPGKTTPVTSALAAELGNLLDQKPKYQTSPIAASEETKSPEAPASVAPKAEPPSNLPIATSPELPSTTVIPPKPTPAPNPVPPAAPMTKLNVMTQKPRVEVELVKNPPAQLKQGGDPYRESVV